MAGLTFAFAGNAPARLHFAWPRVTPTGRLRNPRYTWLPPPVITGVLRNPRYTWLPPPVITGVACNPRYRWLPPVVPHRVGGRYVVPFTPFPGLLPPQNVRAGGCTGAWQTATTTVAPLAAPWGQSARATQSLAAEVRAAPPATRLFSSAWRDPIRGQREVQAVWQPAQDLAGFLRDDWRSLLATGLSGAARWQDSARVSQDLTAPFVRAWRCWGHVTGAWRSSVPQGAMTRPDWRSAPPTGRAFRFPWQSALRRSGLSWPWPPLPPLPPPGLRVALRFHFHGPVDAPLGFHFGSEPAWVLPFRRSYRMIHTMAVVRLPDRTPIPVSGLTLASAWDEWGWNLSATLLGPDAVDLLRPVVSQAVEVEVTVDGFLWRFRLDQVSASSAFAKTGGQTQGRSRAAILGPEVALPANGTETEAKTARQLAEQELTGTDWQLDWGLVDWLVPARRFSYSQKTPIEVLVQLAETAGGRVLADPVLAWVRAVPKYPVPVWEWASTEPDVILPRSLLVTLAWKPRHGQPWDALWLGDGQDVLAQVKRAGLPGVSFPDSPTIEPLLCAAEVCRARGIALLSDAVAGIDFTLALPVSAVDGPSPVRAVGELVRFVDGGKTWAGLITSVSVQVGFGTVVQTLEVRAVEVPA